MGNERKATESLVSRMYQHQLRHTGKLPSGKEVRDFERQAKKVAEQVENKKRK